MDTTETALTAVSPIEALRRLVTNVVELMGNSSGVGDLFGTSGVTPWAALHNRDARLSGWLGESLDDARETLRVHELSKRITLPTEAVTLRSLAQPEYLPLAGVLQLALDQAQSGKGRDRHADDKAFLDQPILDIARMLDGIGGHSYQIMKKAQEAARMVRRDQHAAAVAELLGVIVYASAAVLLIKEQTPADDAA